MYQNIYVEDGEGRGTVHLWDDQNGYTTLPFSQFNYAYKPDNNGSVVSMTGVRVSKTKYYKFDDPTMFESDIPRETRVLTDLYLQDDAPSAGHKVVFFDIEVSMENGIPNIENPNNEVTAITLYDSVTKEYTVLVLDKTVSRGNYKKGDTDTYFFKDEIDLLYKFVDVYESIGPTIITGWNSDYFDVPYLYNRLKQQCGNGVANKLSPIGKLKYSKFRKKWMIAGVSSLDYLDLYKKFTYGQQPNYRLDTIGRIEVGMGKVEYEGSLDELFRTDLDKFIEYNVQDVRIIVELDKKMKLIELVRGICHVGHVQYEDYCYSSKFLEGTIITYLHRKGIVVSNKPADGRQLMNDRMESDGEGFIGAYVKPPIPGLYDWVYSLDLQSLYPSIIMSLNISPETKSGFVTNWDVEKHRNNQIDVYLVRSKETDHVVRMNRENFMKFMNDSHIMISSNGVLYDTNKVGIIPEVLNQWFAERVEYKNLMKKYKNEGNLELADYYDRRQHIQKIFLNSLYGVLGLPIFRFFDIDNALAVTATGQDVIKNSANFANKLYQDKLQDTKDYCIYIDTDSLYFSSKALLPENKDPKEFTINLAHVIEKKLNAYYDDMSKELFFCDNHRFHIKGESVASKGLWIAKKRYAMNVVYDLESSLDIDNKMKVKGLDVIRSTFPPAFREFMNTVLKDVLNGIVKNEMDAKVLEFRIALDSRYYLDVARNTSVKNISEYEKGLSKQLNEFKKGTPAHVKACITYNKLLHHFKITNRYEKISDGEKIKYVYLKNNPLNLETVAVKGYNDPVEIVQLAETYIDYETLFVNELKTKLEDFYSALGWGLLPTDVNQKAEEFFSF
jgi:DNA polymerase elongation subunit (family B)